MIINDPTVVAEVQAAFDRYELALLEGDATTLDALFVASDLTVRYGVSEIQYGIDQIRAYRAAQRPFDRTLDRLVITTYGSAVATAATLFRRPDAPGQLGRQMQTWIKQDGNWRVAAAHVSMMPDT
jgi:hypothetical protein